MSKIALLEIYPNKTVSNVIDAHFRNSVIISKFLGADLLITEADFLSALKKQYDVLILCYASFYAPFRLIRKLCEINKDAKKFVLSNEYNMIPSVGGFKPYEIICNYEKIPNPGKVITKQHFLNLNLLFSRKPIKLLIKKYDCVYYGTFRVDRESYFKRYLRDDIYLSTSKKNVRKYKNLGCSPKLISKLSWKERSETLNLFRYSLYIEDEETHTNFNNLANRWYEAGFCNCVVFFDKNCVNTIRKSEIGEYLEKISFYLVDNYEELQAKIAECNKNFEHHLEIQKSWREKEAVLKSNMLTDLRNIILSTS